MAEREDLRRLAQSLAAVLPELQARCLYKSADFASELLCAIPDDLADAAPRSTACPRTRRHVLRAQTLLAQREFQRAAAAAAVDPVQDAQSTFLHAYATLLALDRRASEVGAAAGPFASGLASALTAAVQSAPSSPDDAPSSTLGTPEELLEMSGLGGPVPGSSSSTTSSSTDFTSARAENASAALTAAATLQTHCIDTADDVEAALARLCGVLEARAAKDQADGGGRLDAYCWWVLGCVRTRLGRRDAARTALLRAVAAEPCLWSAWVDLLAVCPSMQAAVDAVLTLWPDATSSNTSSSTSSNTSSGTGTSIGRRRPWIALVFVAAAARHFHATGDAVRAYRSLLAVLPGWGHAQAALAACLQEQRRNGECLAVLERLYAADPLRVEGTDVYSHVLFLEGRRGDLAALAQRVHALDRYSAETALVVGNYHSLLQNAPEALRHFARAVRLCPRATQAWLLLGYEYLNAHNVRAATAAYRAALDVDSHEFRAWHGLAQTYLMLHQRLHAVYYARRACELQPADPRMWDFLAQCYSEAGDLPSALRASVRAFCLAPEFVHQASFPFSFLSCACFSFSLPFVCLQQRWQLCTGAGVAVQGNEAEPAVGRLLQARGRRESAATEPRGRAPVARRVLSRGRPRRRLPQRVPAHHRHRQRPAARGCQGAPGPAPSLSSPRLLSCPLSACVFCSVLLFFSVPCLMYGAVPCWCSLWCLLCSCCAWVCLICICCRRGPEFPICTSQPLLLCF